MPQAEWSRLAFAGINSNDRADLLGDEELQYLDNWEWTPEGGLTPRPSWRAAGNSPTGEPAQKRGRGIFTGWYQSGSRVLVVSSYDNSANFVTYRTNTDDPTGFTSYTSIDTAAVSASYRSMPMAFAVGNGVLLMTNPGFTSGQVRAYNGTSTSAVATNDIAGRCLVYHLNRFWTGGAISNPTYLRYSEIGDHTNWNTSENFIPVAQDDGEPIENIVVWDRGLVIGKKHSLWFLSGTTIDTFALNPISRTVGCASGRSLIATEDGVFIVGTDGNVYVWDGARVIPLTRSFQLQAVGTGFANAAYVAGKLYIALSNVAQTAWCWDTGKWRREVYADASNDPLEFGVLDDLYLLSTAEGGTRMMSVRKEQGPFATSGYRMAATDTGAGESFTATTKAWWPKGPMAKSTLRSIYIRYHQWQAGAAACKVLPFVDGTNVTAQEKTFGGKGVAGTYAQRLDFNAAESTAFSGRNIGLTFYHDALSGGPVYSIDEVWLKMVADKGVR